VTSPSDTTGWLRPALILVAAVTGLRWILLAFNQTDLFVDEAQYWLWGQEFAFGYYSKPPLIAWLIGAVTWAAGSDAPFWVRMPGAALHGATALILAALAARMYSARVAVWVAASYVTLPMVGLGSLLISTDTVLAPFFAAALYFHRRLIETQAARFALLAGVAIGIGALAKYAVVYFLLGVAVSALLRRDLRMSGRNAAVMLAGFAAVIAPNLIWNLSHQMSTLAHTADNIGWVRQDHLLGGLNPGHLVSFLAAQAAVFGPVLLIGLLAGLRKPGAGRLAGFVLPVLVVVSLQALLKDAYANWAATAYFAGTVLAVAALPVLWRKISLGVNGALCLLLPVLTLLPTLSIDGKMPLIQRYLGRAAFSEQVIAQAKAAGDVPVVAASRDILADLFYTGRDAGLTFYAVPPKGRALDHYQQRYPVPADLTGQVLLVTETPPSCAGQGAPMNTAGGAYLRHAYAGYLISAECLHDIE
jgi:4-amino-4-deoxy-L-arabinose transferase-like glycosyltransferase